MKNDKIQNKHKLQIPNDKILVLVFEFWIYFGF